MTTPDIFLSYNREDAATAKRFADAFAAEGLNVWWDTALRSGEAYDEVTEAALRGAKAVVVLWSPRSVVSRWVRAEATIADRCKTLVPVTIEACERPIMFELTQTAELSHWTGDSGDGAWQAFLGDVRRFVEREIATPAQLIANTSPPSSKPGEQGSAPSLAVLPFANRSGLPEDEVFAIGMAEDVIDALSQGVNVRVLSSSSTARFGPGAITDIVALGRQLRVRYLLEGNVRRTAQELRVTTQLVEAASGEILWTQKFDRPLEELAALQEDLVSELAGSLGARVFRLEMARSIRKPADLTAWECCTRAISAYRQFTPNSIQVGIEEASQAITIAPDYGLAHALLAAALSVAYSYFSFGEPDPQTRHHIDRALALDPDNASVLAFASEALVKLELPDEGLRHAKRAIQLSPRAAYAHYQCGVACVKLDRPEEALRHFTDFLRIEPESHLAYQVFAWIGGAHILNRDLAAAEVAFDRSLELEPHSSFVWHHKAIIASRQHRPDEAHKMMITARQLEPAASLALWEIRLKRWSPAGSLLHETLDQLGRLWAKTEGSI